MAQTPTLRAIRPPSKEKQSFLRKAVAFPGLLWDSITDNINTNYDVLERTTSISLSIIINCVALAAVFVVEEWNTKFIVLTSILVVSFINSVKYFSATKPYQLFSTPPEELADRSNVEVAVVPVFSNDPHAVRTVIITKCTSLFLTPSLHQPHERKVAVLHVWNPSVFSRVVFKFCSPITVLCWVFGINMESLGSQLISVGLALLSMWTVWTLLSRYEQLLDDTKLIASEAYEENNKFALNRIAVLKKDASTQTEPITTTIKETSPYYNPSKEPVAPPAHRPTSPFLSQPSYPTASSYPSAPVSHQAATATSPTLPISSAYPSASATPTTYTSPAFSRLIPADKSQRPTTPLSYNSPSTQMHQSPYPSMQPLQTYDDPLGDMNDDNSSMDIDESPAPNRLRPRYATSLFFDDAPNPHHTPTNTGTESPLHMSTMSDAPPMQSLTSFL